MEKERPKEICRKCDYYMQHYVLVGGVYRWAYLGHCVQGRLRARRPDAKACGYYQEKLPESLDEE